MKTLTEVALEAAQIFETWNRGAEIDAAFDGGEFSGPAADRAARREIEKLAAASGFTFDEIETELFRVANEETEEAR